MKAIMILFAILMSVNIAKAASDPEALALIDRIDKLYRADSSETEMTMKITTPDWSREMRLKSWSRGMKKTLIRILSPKKDEGVTTLRVGNEMWNYFPKVNKVVKVPPSMMMGSWMGSDFTNDDLVRESSLVEDYDASLMETPNGDRLTLIPKEKTATVWGKIEILVDKASGLPTEQTYYDEKGNKVRTMKFREVREVGGRRIPTVMELVPVSKTGHSTVVTYGKAQFNQKIDDSVFSLRELQKK